MKFLLLFLIIILNCQNLSAVEFLGKFEQGSFILGKAEPGSKIFIDNNTVVIDGIKNIEYGKEFFAEPNNAILTDLCKHREMLK